MTNTSKSKMTRDEVRAQIALLVWAHPEAPRELNLYVDFFVSAATSAGGRKSNFAIWTRGCAPELVAELRALCDRLDELDAAKSAAKGGAA